MRINHAVRVMITSDFFVNAGFSVFAPVFAIFVTKQVQDGTLTAVGFAVAIVQIFKSILQIPIARYLDKNHGEYDDFYSLILGYALIAAVPFSYIFATSLTHIYLIQAVYGIGLAFAIPPWYAIFSRHLDKLHESVEWSLDSVAIGIAAATSAALGGFLAQKFGFRFVFLLGGLLTIYGSYTLLKIYRDLRGHVRRGVVKPVPDKTG